MMIDIISLVALAVALIGVVIQYRAWKNPKTPKNDDTNMDSSVQNNPIITVNVDVHNDRRPYNEQGVPPDHTAKEEKQEHREQPAK